MRRDQLEHAIRAACQIAGLTEVIIVGSQAILGTYTEDELPFYATRSAEVDVLPIADGSDEIARLADEIEGVAGEFSPFAELHGFNIDGVDLQTSALPEDGVVGSSGSEPEYGRPIGRTSVHRLVPRQGGPVCGKLCALREKDQNFVDALITANLVDPRVITTRLTTVPEAHRPAAERAAHWLAHRTISAGGG